METGKQFIYASSGYHKDHKQPYLQALCAFHTGTGTWFNIIAHGQDHSKDRCASVPFAGDNISTLSLWYKQALKSSYKKCRFTAFVRSLRIADVLAHAKLLPFYLLSTLHFTRVRKGTMGTIPNQRFTLNWVHLNFIIYSSMAV